MSHAYALLGTEDYICQPINEAVFAEGATQFCSTVPQFVPDDFRAAADAILMEQLHKETVILLIATVIEYLKQS